MASSHSPLAADPCPTLQGATVTCSHDLQTIRPNLVIGVIDYHNPPDERRKLLTLITTSSRSFRCKRPTFEGVDMFWYRWTPDTLLIRDRLRLRPPSGISQLASSLLFSYRGLSIPFQLALPKAICFYIAFSLPNIIWAFWFSYSWTLFLYYVSPGKPQSYITGVSLVFSGQYWSLSWYYIEISSCTALCLSDTLVPVT